MIYNMVSSKSVIAKIIADFDLKEDEIRITDIRQWIGEAMEHIGSVNQLDHRVAVLPLKGYQAQLPCDLHRLNSVVFSFGENGGWLPMIKTTNTFSVFKPHVCECCEDECINDGMLIQDTKLIPLVKNMFNFIDDKDALDEINKNPNIRHTLSALINEYTYGNGSVYSSKLQYDIKPGWVYTNIPDGYIKISYSAIHTDPDGMPVIPDMASYFEAIYWYVAMKLSFPKYYRGELALGVYYDIKRSWNFYRQLAYAESLIPNTDELESISNTWHKLYPEINDHDTMFDSTGYEQIIYNLN